MGQGEGGGILFVQSPASSQHWINSLKLICLFIGQVFLEKSITLN